MTSSLSDAQHPGTLASSITYNPSGNIEKMTYGNGLIGTNVFNNRLQPCRASISSSNPMLQSCTDGVPASAMQDFTYGYNSGTANNGNVISMTQYLPVALNTAMLSQSGFVSGDYYPAQIADGGTACCGWATDHEAAGAWLQVDLGSGNPRAITGIRVYAASSGYAGNYNIQYSDNATSWSTASSGFAPSNAGWNWQSWTSVGAHRYWRLYLANTPGGGAWLTELEFIAQSTRSYGYDSLNRLTSMSSPLDTCLGLTWNYDAWGNRSGQTATGGICNLDTETILSNNQLSGYSYDAAGNMTWDGQHHYTYDAENRIVSVDSGAVQFIYDAQGRRVGKITASGWRDYLYGTSGEVLSEATLSGSTYAWPSGYAYFGGQMLAQYENSTTYLAGHDHLGSTKLMTMIDQTVYDAMDYLPFGEQIAGNWGTTHKFTGNERDTEDDLDRMGLRYYSSSLSRFTRPDPIQTSGFQHMHDPQAWNGYAYARNSPLIYVDPDGLNYTLCGPDGKDCHDLTDDQYNQWRKDNPSVKQSPSGTLESCSESGCIKIGNAQYYNEKDIAAAAMLANAGRQLSDPRTIGLFYGISALGGFGLYSTGLFEGGFTTLGLTGSGEIIGNDVAGTIIGWGTGQEGAAATKQLARSLTRKAVQEMVDKGLTKATVQRLIFQYGRAIAEGGAKLANTQLMPRYQLMLKILDLWPK